MDSVRLIASLLCPILIVVTVGYAVLCTASPFGTCRRCSGTGRRGRRPCRRCDATGIRIRLGRHLFHLAARVHRDGTR